MQYVVDMVGRGRETAVSRRPRDWRELQGSARALAEATFHGATAQFQALRGCSLTEVSLVFLAEFRHGFSG